MPHATTMIVSALLRRDDRLRLVEERMASVAWYDCVPLERFLSADAPSGATYVADGT